MKKCLDEFALASGQKINLEKSKLFSPLKFNKEEVTRISMEAGIPITDDLGWYLGTQLVHHRHDKVLCNHLIKRYKKKMNGWKAKCLSLAGRIMLANSIITILPVFQMQAALIPTVVTKEMDRAIRRCIWGELEGQQKVHLINWETCVGQKKTEVLECVEWNK